MPSKLSKRNCGSSSLRGRERAVMNPRSSVFRKRSPEAADLIDKLKDPSSLLDHVTAQDCLRIHLALRCRDAGMDSFFSQHTLPAWFKPRCVLPGLFRSAMCETATQLFNRLEHKPTLPDLVTLLIWCCAVDDVTLAQRTCDAVAWNALPEWSGGTSMEKEVATTQSWQPVWKRLTPTRTDDGGLSTASMSEPLLDASSPIAASTWQVAEHLLNSRTGSSQERLSELVRFFDECFYSPDSKMWALAVGPFAKAVRNSTVTNEITAASKADFLASLSRAEPVGSRLDGLTRQIVWCYILDQEDTADVICAGTVWDDHRPAAIASPSRALLFLKRCKWSVVLATNQS